MTEANAISSHELIETQPAQPGSIIVGSIISTEEEFAALPIKAVIRGTNAYGTVAERIAIEDGEYRWLFNRGGCYEHETAVRYIGKALVIYLP